MGIGPWAVAKHADMRGDTMKWLTWIFTAKKKLMQVLDVLDQLESLKSEYDKAAADGKVTKAEMSRLMGRLGDLTASAKSLL
jgi:flagellar biosynthesis/type III secretory pathway chaperone